MTEALRICFFGTYVNNAGYPVNRVLIKGLEDAGGEISLCHETLWQGFLHEAFAKGGIRNLVAIALRAVVAYARLIRRYWTVGSHQVVVVGKDP